MSKFRKQMDDVLLFADVFFALHVDIKQFISVFQILYFRTDPEHLILRLAMPIPEIVEYFLDADHAAVNASPAAELVEENSGRGSVRRHAEGGSEVPQCQLCS